MNKSMIIRTIVLAVALINQSLVLAGYSPLPFDNVQVESFFTGAFTVGASILAWWKDNDVTKKARENKMKLKELNDKE
jgi:SPP1 family holin